MEDGRVQLVDQGFLPRHSEPHEAVVFRDENAESNQVPVQKGGMNLEVDLRACLIWDDVISARGNNGRFQVRDVRCSNSI